MTAIELNTQYINLKTGETVEVTKVDGHRTEIVTVTLTGARINPRSVPTGGLKATAYNNRGDFLTTGLVAVEALPDGHPLKPQSAASAALAAAAADPAAMDDEELHAYASACKARMELTKGIYETARDELASRTPDDGGVRVRGTVAVEATPTRRISESLAREVLSDKQLALVSISKVDSGLVKKLLGEDTYNRICKDHGWTIKVREATDKDYETERLRREAKAAKAEIDYDSVEAVDLEDLAA